VQHKRRRRTPPNLPKGKKEEDAVESPVRMGEKKRSPSIWMDGGKGRKSSLLGKREGTDEGGGGKEERESSLTGVGGKGKKKGAGKNPSFYEREKRESKSWFFLEGEGKERNDLSAASTMNRRKKRKRGKEKSARFLFIRRPGRRRERKSHQRNRVERGGHPREGGKRHEN